MKLKPIILAVATLSLVACASTKQSATTPMDRNAPKIIHAYGLSDNGKQHWSVDSTDKDHALLTIEGYGENDVQPSHFELSKDSAKVTMTLGGGLHTYAYNLDVQKGECMDINQQRQNYTATLTVDAFFGKKIRKGCAILKP